MTFTDDNLKRLKDPRNEGFLFRQAELLPLLIRLKAAEEYAETLEALTACTQEDFDTSDGDGYVLQEMVKEKKQAWCKAAGK